MKIRRLEHTRDLDPEVISIARAVFAEVNPDDPPVGSLELDAWLFGHVPDSPHYTWVAERDERPVGVAVAETWNLPDHEHLADLHVFVDPPHRRQGIARDLARVAIDALAEMERTSLMGFTITEPGAAFCESLGLTFRQNERCSRLRVDNLDVGLMRAWIDDRPNAGYRLEQWQGRCPDHFMALVCEAQAAMADAPLDDLEWSEVRLDIDLLRSRDEHFAAHDATMFGSVAVAPDGSAAGFSELLVYRERPQLAHQHDTGVLAAHRGHRLGRWLKAANLLQALEAEPRIEIVETYNAESNPWMLDINVTMGFHPHVTYCGHQGPLADARARLQDLTPH